MLFFRGLLLLRKIAKLRRSVKQALWKNTPFPAGNALLLLDRKVRSLRGLQTVPLPLEWRIFPKLRVVFCYTSFMKRRPYTLTPRKHNPIFFVRCFAVVAFLGTAITRPTENICPAGLVA